ncbi:MAG: hypothetical protein ABI893_03380 [Polaromonas sp.]|uniref:hypothetical protein n=1 Tax=Polaromonas sp. TaxID=1869339 RepID=UPI0032637245
MLPPANDLFALLGIDLVLCAGCLRLLSWRYGGALWTRWVTAAVFVLLWCPVGSAGLPLLAYVRGVSSDLSISLVVLACLGMYRRLSGEPPTVLRERTSVNLVFAMGALFLYPLALGWGDWDAYRLGWGSPGLGVVLLLVSIMCWVKGFRLVPVLVAVALLAWVAGAMESTNLWDYLIDPWLGVAAIFQSIKLAVGRGFAWLRRMHHGTISLSP